MLILLTCCVQLMTLPCKSIRKSEPALLGEPPLISNRNTVKRAHQQYEKQNHDSTIRLPNHDKNECNQRLNTVLAEHRKMAF